ncbi:MAG: hypothetical protein VST68_07690 [Nitrospirota bacterium]|nr:hypothetical protein [Nitrospirota bacterium]
MIPPGVEARAPKTTFTGLGRIHIRGLLNISLTWPINSPDEIDISSGREWSKKSVQQGRSQFDARSVLIVREHGKLARTPLAAFFIIPRSKTHDASMAIT